MVGDAKVLKGNSDRHSLPDFSHSPNRKYIKENSDGKFRELREFDEKGFPIIEIAYHPEQSLTGNRYENVLHFHIYNGLDRESGGRISSTEHADIYRKFKKYLEVYGL